MHVCIDTVQGLLQGGRSKKRKLKVPEALDHFTQEEEQKLIDMDSEQYATLVAQPRPSMALNEPSDSVIFPKAEALFKAARIRAAKRIKAMKSSAALSPSPMACLRSWCRNGLRHKAT